MATHETPEHHARVAALTFAGVYPHYVAKVEKKGRSESELLEVIQWLTGYTQADLDRSSLFRYYHFCLVLAHSFNFILE